MAVSGCYPESPIWLNEGIWVVVKILVPFWIPEILGAVLY